MYSERGEECLEYWWCWWWYWWWYWFDASESTYSSSYSSLQSHLNRGGIEAKRMMFPAPEKSWSVPKGKPWGYYCFSLPKLRITENLSSTVKRHDGVAFIIKEIHNSRGFTVVDFIYSSWVNSYRCPAILCLAILALCLIPTITSVIRANLRLKLSENLLARLLENNIAADSVSLHNCCKLNACIQGFLLLVFFLFDRIKYTCFSYTLVHQKRDPELWGNSKNIKSIHLQYLDPCFSCKSHHCSGRQNFHDSLVFIR